MRTIITAFTILIAHGIWACTGGTNAGTLTPTSTYQTQNVSNGQYYVVNVTCGSTYHFTFCSNGGSASWDTQITINQTNNTTQLAYNDDACGLQSNVTWTANFTGQIHVLISQFSCNNGGGSNGTLAYNVTPTSVIYNAGCTTASPTVSGSNTGTYAFNPIPTDGATINSSTGAISNAVEGSSYTVQYTYCGGTITVPVTMGTAPCWALNGNAQWITVGAEQCIQLTAEINNQTGCAWNDSQIDFNSDFTLSLDYYFGNNGNGADGNTFTFQPSSSTACGQNGGQLGAGGIPNALAIEFDTYDNDNPTHLYDTGCDHIAVEIDGNMLGPGAPLCGPVCAKPGGGNIDDGGTYSVDIVWDASTTTLEVYFNGVLRLTCVNDFITNAFAGNSQVYWGATSATGGLNNQQYFCPSSVVILPTALTSFSSICEGNQERFIWETASEQRTDYFQLEYTYDGFIFYPEGIVAAAGNSSQPKNYSILTTTNDTRQRYYRLKLVDTDGEFEFTELIASHRCGMGNSIIVSTSQSAEQLKITTKENCTILIHNSLGQQLIETKTIGNSTEIQRSFASGVYLITAITDNGNVENQRIYVE